MFVLVNGLSSDCLRSFVSILGELRKLCFRGSHFDQLSLETMTNVVIKCLKKKDNTYAIHDSHELLRLSELWP